MPAEKNFGPPHQELNSAVRVERYSWDTYFYENFGKILAMNNVKGHDGIWLWPAGDPINFTIFENN